VSLSRASPAEFSFLQEKREDAQKIINKNTEKKTENFFIHTSITVRAKQNQSFERAL
jgi:hypothetical protein